MRYPILPMLGMTLSLTVIAGSVMAIPNFLPESEPKRLHNIDISSLWTSHPMPVDLSKQNLERLPALIAQPQQTSKPSLGVDVVATSTNRVETRLVTSTTTTDWTTAAQVKPVRLAWELPCGAAKTTGHTALRIIHTSRTAGLAVNCEPPFTAVRPNRVASERPQHSSSVAGTGHGSVEHAHWCFARYRSYNPDDNTYRAFSGEIRACASPYI